MVTLCVAALTLSGAPSRADYFGRNKVQYHSFDFQVLHTPHFDIYYYPEEADAARYASRLAERWYARHSVILADSLKGSQPLILYASFPHFEETNVVSGIGVGTGGVTEPELRRIVLPFAGPLGETDHVIGHELVHAFQYDIAERGRLGAAGSSGIERLPLWFIEGMAEYLSLGPVDPNTAMWMREATQHKPPGVRDLENPKYFPYRYGQALLSYIGGRWGDAAIGQLLRRGAKTGNINAAIDSLLQTSTDSLSKDWHQALHAQYDSLAGKTQQPKDYGRVLIRGKTGRGDLNVSPVISPDGNQVAFFSSRNNFSIDLYLADANTGKVVRNIYKSALDTHLEGLEFINSAGSWSSDGKRFVFSGVHKDRPSLEILNVATGKREREIPFPDLGQIFSPAWSPDGKSLAFSALAGGFSDLFLFDLETGRLRQMTHDPYSDLMPAWSPDSRAIAFATDRFTSDLAALKFGEARIATIDPVSGKIAPLAGFAAAENFNPQWSSDGKSLFWISNRHGVPNIYRRDLATGTDEQLTNFDGGVSGITASSPAISVAANTDRLVYSYFESDTYSIWEIDPARARAPSPLEPRLVARDPAALPPEQRTSPELTQNLENPRFGLPADTSEYTTTKYKPRFKLIGAGQTTLGAGVGPFGTFAGGGVSLFFSDLLGNRDLETAFAVQSGSGVTSVLALLAYLDMGHRLNWGGMANQIPYVFTSSGAFTATQNGNPVVVQQNVTFQEVDREVQGALVYPFSRSTRAELTGGYLGISFTQDVETQIFDGNTGLLISDQTQSVPTAKAIHLASGNAALVYDNSLNGATSPILGHRGRLQVGPNYGSLKWTDVLADYRHYLMPVRPFTLAGRILHYGRYGKSSENSLLSPLYLGYPGLVRGYNTGIFGSNAVPAVIAVDSTVALGPLFGSRILVGNFEFRWPLFGALHLGQGFYGAFPIETATFFDTGVAWTSRDKAWFLGGDRRLQSSVGQALRMNFLGFLILELDYAKPLNGPDRHWIWQFNLVEGI